MSAYFQGIMRGYHNFVSWELEGRYHCSISIQFKFQFDFHISQVIVHYNKLYSKSQITPPKKKIPNLINQMMGRY